MEVYFDHDKLRVYVSALGFVAWVNDHCPSQSFSAADHLTRASQSVVRNIARANTKRSLQARSRSFDIAQASALECAACLDVLYVREAVSGGLVVEGKAVLDRIVAMLFGMSDTGPCQVREAPGTYETGSKTLFAHERLIVYQKTLRFVRWMSKLVSEQETGSALLTALDKEATSIVLNIAEGNGRYTTKDRQQFLNTAYASSIQAAATLDILMATRKIDEKLTNQGKSHLHEIACMVAGLRDSLQNS